jgi:hypothetical protein
MMLPLVKLGSLAFRTLSKPIAARLKYNAGIHPKFRGLIIGLAQVIDAPSIPSGIFFPYCNLCADAWFRFDLPWRNSSLQFVFL